MWKYCYSIKVSCSVSFSVIWSLSCQPSRLSVKSCWVLIQMLLTFSRSGNPTPFELSPRKSESPRPGPPNAPQTFRLVSLALGAFWLAFGTPCLVKLHNLE
ncbi:unnamed protein product [Cuscuta epithymum]|uniref:Uncharacterized protein n=1 Tax=Cuscuta epithymum TaxID=186058 RepID=A0AAV0D1S6_9ASTE|nr:unnamed protein product [Cuscuta epithymum]